MNIFIMHFRLTREQLLLDLYEAYKSARTNKRKTTDQQRFELNLEAELVQLSEELYARKYRPRQSICFIIRDPKQREVFAAHFRDRVVHHLYYNYTHELYERFFIADSYSCISGRGTHYGINRLAHHIRSASHNYRKDCYVLKLDIKGYFMHINRHLLHKHCLQMLGKSEKAYAAKLDFSLIRYLTSIFTLQNPVIGCKMQGRQSDWNGLPPSKSLFYSKDGCGLPIGNLTSQLFSNIYMNAFDQYMKRELRCEHYGRYVDDAYVVSSDVGRLRSLIPLVRKFLSNELHLELHKDKLKIDNARFGTQFLGAYLKPWRTYIANNCAQRMKRKLSLMDLPRGIHVDNLQPRCNSYSGLLGHYRGWSVRKDLLCQSHAMFKYGYWGRSLQKFYLNREASQKIIGALIAKVENTASA